MKMRLFRVSLPWLVLAVVLPVLALLFTAGPVGAGCCNNPVPPPTAILRVHVNPDGGGGVEFNGLLYSSYPFFRTLDEGESFSLEAVPADGYYFVGWSGDLSGDQNPLDLEIFEETDVTAQFFPEEIDSEDNRLQLLFPVGTIVRDKDSAPLSGIEMAIAAVPPSLPPEADIVGRLYELGPHGTTFDNPVTLNLSFDPDEVPEGVYEDDLALGYYDDEYNQWQVLPSSVNLTSHTVSTRVDHLSTFTVIAPLPPVPAAAAFSTSALSVSPLQAGVGEMVTVSVLVTNTGELEGSYSLSLAVNGAIVETREITMAGGSQTVTFSTTADEAGIYSVEVDGLTDSFEVMGSLASSSGGFPMVVVWVLVGLVLLALVLIGVVRPIIRMRRGYDDDYYY